VAVDSGPTDAAEAAALLCALECLRLCLWLQPRTAAHRCEEVRTALVLSRKLPTDAGGQGPYAAARLLSLECLAAAVRARRSVEAPAAEQAAPPTTKGATPALSVSCQNLVSTWCELSAEILDDATRNVRKAPHSAKGDEVLIDVLYIYNVFICIYVVRALCRNARRRDAQRPKGAAQRKRRRGAYICIM